MGFGSYDESEQQRHQPDTDLEADEATRASLHAHDGDVEYEYDDATSEDLLEALAEIKDR